MFLARGIDRTLQTYFAELVLHMAGRKPRGVLLFFFCFFNSLIWGISTHLALHGPSDIFPFTGKPETSFFTSSSVAIYVVSPTPLFSFLFLLWRGLLLLCKEHPGLLLLLPCMYFKRERAFEQARHSTGQWAFSVRGRDQLCPLLYTFFCFSF